MVRWAKKDEVNSMEKVDQPMRVEKKIRNNVFHTRCISHGKVCNMIIDGDCFKNLVIMKMVQKLSLKIVPHPNPYQFCWLQKEIEIKVSKWCLVSFFIENNYKDEVWCDVVPMDVCHLLLGRPWLYYRRVLYDDFKHTYSFVINEKKIILAPL